MIITDVNIDTDYKTKFGVSMKLQDKVFGWAIERYGLEKLMVKLHADTNDFLLGEIVILKTDPLTTFNISAAAFNYLISFDLKGEVAKSLAVELAVLGTKISLLDILVNTDMKTALVIDVHFANKLIGLKLNSEFGEEAADTKSLVGLLINGLFGWSDKGTTKIIFTLLGKAIAIEKLTLWMRPEEMLGISVTVEGKGLGLLVKRKSFEKNSLVLLVDTNEYILADLTVATDLKTMLNLELTLINKVLGIKVDSVFPREIGIGLVFKGKVIPLVHVIADLESPQKHLNVVITLKPLPVITFDVFATVASVHGPVETQATLRVAQLEIIDLKQKTEATFGGLRPVKFHNQFHYALYLGEIVTGDIMATIDLSTSTKTFTFLAEPTAFHKIELISSFNFAKFSPTFVLLKFDTLEIVHAKLDLDIATPTKTALFNVQTMGKPIIAIEIAADIFAPTKTLVGHLKLTDTQVVDLNLEFTIAPTARVHQVLALVSKQVLSSDAELEFAGPKKGFKVEVKPMEPLPAIAFDLMNPIKTFTFTVDPTTFHKIEIICNVNMETF